jgi:transcription initiation factor IIE alpha subunit
MHNISKLISGTLGDFEMVQMSLVLSFLPMPGDKKKGKTRKEIASATGMKPKYITILLQKLKRQGSAKCYHSRWRRTQTSF